MKDNDIREALLKKLPFLYDNPENIKIIHELGILQGNARVDVAVIDDYLHGYEIKSDNDTLQRLPQQADSYNKVFDTMTLVISYKYKLNKIEFLPEWWGVVYAVSQNGVIHFDRVRENVRNKEIDTYSLAQLLWKDEALHFLTQYGLSKGLKSKPRTVLWEIIAKNIPLNDIKDRVIKTIRNRDKWRVDPQQMLNDGSHRPSSRSRGSRVKLSYSRSPQYICLQN